MQLRLPFMKYLPAAERLYPQKTLTLIHLRKPICLFKAGLSLFFTSIKQVFLATIISVQRVSELHGLLSPFTAFLLPLPNPNSFLRRSLSYSPK